MKLNLLMLLMLIGMGAKAQTWTPEHTKNLTIVYVKPSDLAVEPNYETRISAILIYAQEFYKQEMARNGYPNKTFGLIKDLETGTKVKIELIESSLPKASLNTALKVADEVNAWFALPGNASKKNSQHVIALMPTFQYDAFGVPVDDIQPNNGTGRYCAARDSRDLDMALKDNKQIGHDNRDRFSKGVGGFMHEIGHALNLPHNNEPAPISGNMRNAFRPTFQVADFPVDYRPSLMGIGNYTLELFPNNPTILTKSDCAMLDINEVFNNNTNTYYGVVRAGLSSIHAIYNATTSSIEASGKLFNNTPASPLSNVVVYLDPDVDNEGTETNTDYQSISYVANSIVPDSFFVSMPLSGLSYKGNLNYQLKIKQLYSNGTFIEAIYPFKFDIDLPLIPNNIIPLNNSVALRPIPWTAVATAKVPINGGAPIPDEQNNTSSKAGNVLDNDVTTDWFTPFSDATKTAFPHEITIDTKSLQTFAGWSYYPSKGGIRIKDVEIYGGDDQGVFDPTPIGTYQLADETSLKYIQFNTQKTFRYFRMKALSNWSAGGNANYAVMAELNLWKGPLSGPQPQSTVVSSANWTVVAGTKTDSNGNTFLDESVDPNENEKATSIIDGDEDTAWYGRYQGLPSSADYNFPHEIIIDTKAMQDFTGWGYAQRPNISRAVKNCEIYGGDVNQNFTLIGSYTLQNKNGFYFLSFPGRRNFRYFKFKALSAHDGDNRASMAELYLFNDPNVVLPVELLSFTAKAVGGTVKLNWATATENNSAYFDLMRFTDKDHLVAIGKVAANGTSSSKINYGYTDYNPLPGTSYYQLHQYDKDGKIATKSDAVAVSILERPYQLTVQSVSANDVNFTIYSAKAGIATIFITNMLGQRVAVKNIKLTAGNNQLNLSANGVGMHLLTVDFNAEVISKKFIK